MPTRDRTAVRAPLGARCRASVRALLDHALLDRIIRGRYWIPLLGLLLVGIVALQVEVLKLNAGIGRALQQSTSLQTRNEQLQFAVAQAADDQRIESRAAHMGMIIPPPASVRFLDNRTGTDVARAVGSIHVPDATSFPAALSTAGTGAAATAPQATGSSASTTATGSSASTAATGSPGSTAPGSGN